MPLQIRRGLEVERDNMAQPLAQGELLYVTDDRRLYIGDGTTLGGVQITGYTDANAKDAAAAIFTGGVHSGINFSYNTATDIITATVDLSNYTGTINASAFKGTLVADDSTLLVDAVDGKINLDGTVKGNIIPNANEIYDIGSSSLRFRDLYLSGSSIELGSATITSVGSAVNLPAGSTINGVVIGTGSGAGVEAGMDYNINIVGDNSTNIINATTNTITGTLRTGTLTLQSDTLSSSTNIINLGSNQDPIDILAIKSESTNIPVKIYGITDSFGGAFQGPFTERLAQRGTIATPAIIQNGDFISGDIALAYTANQGIGGTGYSYVGVTGFGHELDTAISPTSEFLEGFWYVAVSNGSAVDLTGDSLSFHADGKLYCPIFAAKPKNQTAVNAVDAEEGLIVFNSTTQKFQGYVSDTGLAGGGAPNSTPGWVNLN
jgi:hypothetical protein